MYKIFVGCMLFASLYAGGLTAQDSLGFQRYQTIGIDFQKRSLDPSYLPFDVPYRLYIAAPDSLGIDSILMQASHIKGRFRKPTKTTPQPIQTVFGVNDSLNSILVFKRDIFSKDTLYANINVPLRPSQSYTFHFTVYRKVTDKESRDLDSIFTPMIVQSLDTIYRNNDAEVILYVLRDSTGVNLSRLTDAMTDKVIQYFYKRNVEPKRNSVRSSIETGLPGYLTRTYGVPMAGRLFYYEAVARDIHDAQESFTDPRNPAKLLQKNYLIIKLDSLCMNASVWKSYGIDTPTSRFIHNILMDEDSLQLFLGAVRSEIDSGFQMTKEFSIDQINTFHTNLVSFYASCARVDNLLKTVLLNPSASGHIFASSDGVNFAPDRVRFQEFYYDVLHILRDMNVFYRKSVDFDALINKPAQFNFKSEFPIHFQDGSIGLTSADFVTRGAWSILADIGFAYVNTYPTGQLRPYVGVNFNVFPINRQANYSLFKHPYYTFIGNFVRSLSFTVGVTVFSTFGNKDRYTELLGTTGSPLTGLALRLSDGIRLSGGVLWVYQKSSNPLSDEKTLAPLGYGALSVDLTLKKWLGGLAKFFN